MSSLDNNIETITTALRDLLEERTQEVSLVDIPFVEFKAGKDGNLVGKGLIWSGKGITKQLIVSSNPDRLFTTENFDIAKDKVYSIGNVPVLSENSLGSSITSSSLREVGRLKNLVVDGNVIINEYLYYDATSDRLGIGTDSPNAAISIAENGVEIIIGTSEGFRAQIGTFASDDFDIITDSTSRLTVKANGDIELGNRANGAVKVTVNGVLAINSDNIDPRVQLQVAGSIKFGNNLHITGSEPPSDGSYTKGDIMWNTDPGLGKCVGWVCVNPGRPGQWLAFGQIFNQS